MADREAQRLLDSDSSRHVVVLVDSAAYIHAIGEFMIDSSGRTADLTLVVEDNFQGRGVGRALLGRLTQLAYERGVTQLTGDVAYGNERALSLLRSTGGPLRLQPEYGALRFALGIARSTASCTVDR